MADPQRSRWGGDFVGWRQQGAVLVGTMGPAERNTYLTFGGVPRDFELELDVHCAAPGNSGVQLRSRYVEGRPDPVGYQADVGLGFWGSVYATDGRGLLAAPEAAALASALDPDGWNHLFVRAVGSRLYVELNGVPMVDLEDDAHAAGDFVGFQLHRGEAAKVFLTNLRLR